MAMDRVVPQYPPFPTDPNMLGYGPLPGVPSLALTNGGQMGVDQSMLPYGQQVQAVLARTPQQKKEIKRRTKTGCLTCRKRRIKVCFESSVDVDSSLSRSLRSDA